MVLIFAVFYFSLFVLFYNYVGYGGLLVLLVRAKRLFARPKPAAGLFEPSVSLVVAAYNEEAFIEQKILNTLALDYPAKKLQVIFVTDGSTDRTPDIILRYPAITLLHEPARSGKTAAINRAMRHVQAPVTIFCDANTLLNTAAIRNIVKHYVADNVGGVAGEKKVIGSEGAAATEGIYWKYESALKKLDAALYTVVGAAGELFSVRTALFPPTEPDIVLDDFVISLRICQQGYRIAYAPDAYAMEAPSTSIREEYKRKVRISAGGFQAIARLVPLLNIFRYPVLSFQYISHRVLRWTLSPLSLALLLASNIVLAIISGSAFFNICLALQLAGYALAWTGYRLAERNIKTRIFYVPFYFVFMNLAVYQGFFRYLFSHQSAAWERSARKVISN